MTLLPYEIINMILLLSCNNSDIYYLQVDYTGKLVYKRNFTCPKLQNLKINIPIVEDKYIYYNNYITPILSCIIYKNDKICIIYKKNIENTIFAYLRMTLTYKFLCYGYLYDNEEHLLHDYIEHNNVRIENKIYNNIDIPYLESDIIEEEIVTYYVISY